MDSGDFSSKFDYVDFYIEDEIFSLQDQCGGIDGDFFVTYGLGRVDNEQDWQLFVERFGEDNEKMDSAEEEVLDSGSEKELEIIVAGEEMISCKKWQRNVCETGLKSLAFEFLNYFGYIGGIHTWGHFLLGPFPYLT